MPTLCFEYTRAYQVLNVCIHRIAYFGNRIFYSQLKSAMEIHNIAVSQGWDAPFHKEYPTNSPLDQKNPLNRPSSLIDHASSNLHLVDRITIIPSASQLSSISIIPYSSLKLPLPPLPHRYIFRLHKPTRQPEAQLALWRHSMLYKNRKISSIF